MRFGFAIALFVSAFSLFAADDLAKQVHRDQPDKILARKDVAGLPFVARDQLLLRVSPEYRALKPSAAFGFLRKEETSNSGIAGLKPLKPFIWFKGCRECGEYFSEGKHYLTLDYGPLILTISVGQFEKYVDAWVHVALAKDAKVTVDVMSANVALAETVPRILQTERASLREVAKTVQHGAGWKAALVGGLGGMATRDVNVNQAGDFNGTYNGPSGYGSVSGTYNGRSTVQVPDDVARENAQARARQLVHEAQARSAGVVETALLDTTLRPGESLGGFAYFKRDKAMKSSVLQVAIGTVSFEFPLEWK
jgi:hypothetical protein